MSIQVYRVYGVQCEHFFIMVSFFYAFLYCLFTHPSHYFTILSYLAYPKVLTLCHALFMYVWLFSRSSIDVNDSKIILQSSFLTVFSPAHFQHRYGFLCIPNQFLIFFLSFIFPIQMILFIFQQVSIPLSPTIFFPLKHKKKYSG